MTGDMILQEEVAATPGAAASAEASVSWGERQLQQGRAGRKSSYGIMTIENTQNIESRLQTVEKKLEQLKNGGA